MKYPKLEELKTGSKIVERSNKDRTYTVIQEHGKMYCSDGNNCTLSIFNAELRSVSHPDDLYITEIYNPDGSLLWDREAEFPQIGQSYYVPTLRIPEGYITNVEYNPDMYAVDRWNKRNNLICKTPEEAILKSEIMLDAIKPKCLV